QHVIALQVASIDRIGNTCQDLAPGEQAADGMAFYKLHHDVVRLDRLMNQVERGGAEVVAADRGDHGRDRLIRRRRYLLWRQAVSALRTGMPAAGTVCTGSPAAERAAASASARCL